MFLQFLGSEVYNQIENEYKSPQMESTSIPGQVVDKPRSLYTDAENMAFTNNAKALNGLSLG